jgi:hypothetical protein
MFSKEVLRCIAEAGRSGEYGLRCPFVDLDPVQFPDNSHSNLMPTFISLALNEEAIIRFRLFDSDNVSPSISGLRSQLNYVPESLPYIRDNLLKLPGGLVEAIHLDCFLRRKESV